MSQIHNNRAHAKIHKANGLIRKIQRKLNGDLSGRLVKIVADRRGTHSRRRYKAGTVFKVYHLLVEGDDVFVWLSLPDTDFAFEMAAHLHEVEFLPKVKP